MTEFARICGPATSIVPISPLLKSYIPTQNNAQKTPTSMGFCLEIESRTAILIYVCIGIWQFVELQIKLKFG